MSKENLLTNDELKSIGNKVSKVVIARVNKVLKAAYESSEEYMSIQDLDKLLMEIEQSLVQQGIDAEFRPI